MFVLTYYYLKELVAMHFIVLVDDNICKDSEVNEQIMEFLCFIGINFQSKKLVTFFRQFLIKGVLDYF